VINTPRLIEHDLATWRDHLKRLALEPLRREEESELEAIRVRDEAHVPDAFTTHDWSKALPKLRPTYAQVSHRPLSTKETNRLLMRGWCPAGVTLPEMNSETVAVAPRVVTFGS
jgi:hypothetical protein